jgi:hypothetical protein
MTSVKDRRLQFLLALFIAVFCKPLTVQAQGQQIEPGLSTANGWYFNYSTPASTFALELDTIIDKVAASGIKFVRINGIGPNFVPQYTWNAVSKTVDTTQIEKFVHLINLFRSKGIEPILAVGFNPVCSTNTVLNTLFNESRANQAIIAGNVVNAVNKQLLWPNKRIQNWIIANEPDLAAGSSPTCYLQGFGYGTTIAHSDSIAAYFKDFATKMKTADSSITIIGPEIAAFGNDTNYILNKIMRRLISNPGNSNSITGTITSGPAAGKYFCDIFSFHQYMRTATNHSDIIASVTATNTLQKKISSSGSNYRGMVEMITNTVTGRNISNARIAITEINVDSPDGIDENASWNNVINGYGSRSFIGAQWLAEMQGQAMDNASGGTPWLKFFAQWSIKEGDNLEGKGFLSGSSNYKGRKRPSWHHTNIIANHFIGRFYRGTPNTSGVTSFASAQSFYGYKVLVINMDSTNSYGCQINTLGNTTTTTGTHPLILNYNFTGDPSVWTPTNSPNITYLTPTNNPIPRASTVMFVFDCYGNFVYRKDYTKDDAKINGEFHLRQIGNTVVDASMIQCPSSALSGTVSSSTTYSGQTVAIGGTLTIGNNVALNFNADTILVSAGGKIIGTKGSTLTLNRCVMIGCQENIWEGIEMDGQNSGEKLDIDSSAIIFANYPLKLDKVPNISITQSAFANGIRGIQLIQPRAFQITDVLVGGFGACITTTNAQSGYRSDIRGCYTMDTDTGMYFSNSTHDSLYINCNRIEFRTVGLKTDNSTTLKNFGTSSVGAGNRFINISHLDQINFIDHNGNSPTYYYDPIFAPSYTGSPMNITATQASSNASCPAVVMDSCAKWPEIQGVNEIVNSSRNNFNVYPNPSSGTFNLTSGNTSPDAELIIYDLMGRIVLYRKVNFLREKTITFELKDKGLYFATLRSQSGQGTKKIIVE